jgi:hypothetical protein
VRRVIESWNISPELQAKWDLARSRRHKIKRMRDEGKTFKAIGEAVGVCGERAAQLYRRALRDEQ